ncbi:MAG: Na+/H+ antiporter subunit E [Xanthobacteraceae bacterium]|nr:Na+/H+ antiporter subunit E [Xanthobacteraceae bacterium]PWB66040.1 MAG: hypothetical protein C3F17_02445 [Bradyrhizobiaceae bacterium]
MAAASTFLRRLALLAGVWLVLTENQPSAWLVGALAAGAGAAISLRLLPPQQRRVRLARVLRLAPGFVGGSLLGGIDVARRVFQPRMPLDPGWLSYRTRLPAGAPRVALGAEISLMPGTLAAGMHGDLLHVHCLDRRLPVAAFIAHEEARIARSIGVAPDPTDG